MDKTFIVLIISILIFLSAISIYSIKEGFIGTGIFIILIVVILILSVGIDYYNTSKCTKYQIETLVTVTDKQYLSSSTVYVNKIMIHRSAKWEVTISDNSFKQVIDNKDLYDNVQIRDKIIVNKIIYKDKNNKIYKQEFILKERNENE